jgi:hypothetical protein
MDERRWHRSETRGDSNRQFTARSFERTPVCVIETIFLLARRHGMKPLALRLTPHLPRIARQDAEERHRTHRSRKNVHLPADGSALTGVEPHAQE